MLLVPPETEGDAESLQYVLNTSGCLHCPCQGVSWEIFGVLRACERLSRIREFGSSGLHMGFRSWRELVVVFPVPVWKDMWGGVPQCLRPCAPSDFLQLVPCYFLRLPHWWIEGCWVAVRRKMTNAPARDVERVWRRPLTRDPLLTKGGGISRLKEHSGDQGTPSLQTTFQEAGKQELVAEVLNLGSPPWKTTYF